MTAEIRALLDRAAAGPPARLDVEQGWRRGRRRRRRQRVVLAACLLAFVVGAGALLRFGFSGDDSMRPTVDLPPDVSPVPGLEVSLEMVPEEVEPGRVSLATLRVTNTTDEPINLCPLADYNLELVGPTTRGTTSADRIGPPREGACEAALERMDVRSTSVAPPDGEVMLRLRPVTAIDPEERPLPPGTYVLTASFPGHGAAHAALSVREDPTTGTTLALDAEPGSEGYVSPGKAAMYPVWVDEYDPAEVRWLEGAAGAPLTDQQLVTRLEYRRACRTLDRTYAEVVAAPPDERATIVDRLLEPQIERLRERESDGSTTDALYERIAAGLIDGDVRLAEQQILSCQESIDWRPGDPPPG